MLAEEDKSNLLALEYWFRVVDLDGDGARARECAFFTRSSCSAWSA